MKYILFNPRSNNNRGKASAEELKKKLGECECQDVTKLNSYKNFFEYLSRDDKVYLVGGDGTLNYFINETDGTEILPELYFYPAGTGNDFLKDVAPDSKEPIKINDFLKNLPTVIVKGQAYKFINGVGYGLDGMCCQVGDDLKAKSNKEVNYTSIALKQVLYAYRPKNAKVTVDGVTKEYKNVWILPTMKGRYYGGGMKVAPDQDRNDPEGKVTIVIVHSSLRLKLLFNFPKIFAGKHTELPIVDILKGKEVSVEYDKPAALQIDGETIRDVLGYTVKA